MQGTNRSVMENNEIGPSAFGQRITRAFDMKDTTNSAMRGNRINDQPDFPALIKRERISREEKWKNRPNDEKEKRRRKFDTVVAKIDKTPDQGKSALIIELNGLP
jgi:hypothetical protein